MNQDNKLHDALKKIYGADELLSYSVTVLLRDGESKVVMRTISTGGESQSRKNK